MPIQTRSIENVGKIAERIVANELEMQGFLVRDLNMEGVAANADLIAFKGDEKWLIQVKGSSYDTSYPNNGWWFQYGYCKQEHIDDNATPMYNLAKGPLKANIVALVCVRSASEYQIILLPLDVAEKASGINLCYAYRTPKPDGSKKRPNIVYVHLFPSQARSKDRQEKMKEERSHLREYLLDRGRRLEEKERNDGLSASSELFSRVFSPAINILQG
jgi:hypothetical protein